jgi:GalNAc-alpha-(1->4)-GalNAc-alpha-(1->3)-diNAcBac-PP-undecaprenol alpha-1,4-N-acetyl-D-galactosaminyltransferase
MRKSRTKIALLLPSLHAGGMERVMSELANYFSLQNKTEVHLILFGKSPEIFYQLNKNVVIYKINDKFNNRLRIVESFKRLLFVRNEIKNIKPNTILSFGTQWNNFILLSLYGTNFPIFISDRGSPVRKYKGMTEFLKTVLYKNASGIIAQTNKALEITSKRFPNSRIRVIGNPINLIENKISKPENVILSVGRLISSKHHDRLIEVFSKLNAPNWKLIIVGGDALKEKNNSKLKSLVNKKKLESRVLLMGSQKNVDKYYLSSKVFAFTSSLEGFPNVIGEALSYGLPVVSYDCLAGPSEMIVDGENGFLIPVFDDILFQQQLQLIIDNEDLQNKMAKNARKSIMKFSAESIGKQYLNFILS